MSADALEAWELARSERCIGCAGERPARGTDGGGSLWCPTCWREFRQTGTLPDLLDGGRALHGG